MKKLAACLMILALVLGCTPSLADDAALPGDYVWYQNNHAVAFGPQIEGDWKTYAVADLAWDGVQSFKLVAGSMWHIGTVDVAVEGDSVTVSYRLFDNAYTSRVLVKGEYLNLAAAIPTQESIREESSFRFGEPFSIEKDLAGETIVTLYVELLVDYQAFRSEDYRHWPNTAQNRTIVEEMRFNWGLRAE